jgi:hypothetical protein
MSSELNQLLRAYKKLNDNERDIFKEQINSIGPTVTIRRISDPPQKATATIKPLRRPAQHPPPKSYPDGHILADSIKGYSALSLKQQIEFRNAIEEIGLLSLEGQYQELIVSDVHRNEQVNVAALCEGKQTILCQNLSRKVYALVPMVGTSASYKPSEEGIYYQNKICGQYDSRLDSFPRIYVAKVYAEFVLYKNSVEFWQDMKGSGLFKYWDPTDGPFAFIESSRTKKVQMLRVFKADRDLSQFFIPNKGYRNAPVWNKPPVKVKCIPILSEKEMETQLDFLNLILKNHGMPQATKV